MNLGENEKKDSNVEKRNNVQILRTVEILVGKVSELTKATVKMGEKISKLEEEVTSLKRVISVNGTSIKIGEKNLDKVKAKDFFKVNNCNKYDRKNIENDKDRDYKYRKLSAEDIEMQAPRVEIMDEDSVFDEQFNSEEEFEAKNLTFLKKCFQEQIGIPMNEGQTINIFNFDETLIAKGFDKVLTTWQGMFWQHSREDICFRNLEKVEYTAEGVECWRANGVLN